MFQIFKSGQISSLIILLIIFIAVWITGSFSFYDSTTIWQNNFSLLPLNLDGFEAYGLFINPMLLVLYFVVLNNVVNHNDLLKYKGFLPMFFGLILVASLPWVYQLNLQIFAVLILVFGVQKMLKLSQPSATHGDVFDLGFLIGLASLFYLPCLVFFIWIYQALLLLRNFSFREWLMPIVGFLLPFFYLYLFYFLTDRPLPDFNVSEYFHFSLLKFKDFNIGFLVYLIGVFFVFVLSIPKFLNTIQTGKIRIRKSLTLLTWLIFYGILSTVFFSAHWLFMFLLLIIPGSIILASFFEQQRTTKATFYGSILFVISVGFNLLFSLF